MGIGRTDAASHLAHAGLRLDEPQVCFADQDLIHRGGSLRLVFQSTKIFRPLALRFGSDGDGVPRPSARVQTEYDAATRTATWWPVHPGSGSVTSDGQSDTVPFVCPFRIGSVVCADDGLVPD